MAQNYTRQSTFADGDTITAALFNDEYNQLVNAFAYSSTNSAATGHRHDGTAGQGGNIPQIGDLDFNNKIVVDSTNNRWGFFVEVSSAAVEQIRIQDGAIVPVTNNDIDLGTASLQFKDIYIDGTATIDTLTIDSSATIAGLTVSGTSVLQGDVYLGNASADTIFVPGLFQANLIPENDSLWNIGSTSLYWANAYIDAITTTGNVTIGGNLTVTGNATISGNLTFGDADTDTITLGADVASHITPDVDDTYDLGSATKEWRNLYIDGTANIDSLVADTADINAGTIDNTTIGATTASTGNFSTLSINGTAITSTATELNIVDGGTTATSTTLADADRVVVNDAGIMVQVALTDFETYFESALDTLPNVTTVGALNAGSITSGFGAIDNGSSAITTTGTVTYGSLSDGTITITAFVDEDDMISNSATLVPTQQSVKAYVDSQVTAQDLDFQGDSGGALSIDLDSETLTVAGGTGIDTVGATNTLTVSIDSTVTTLTGVQTLTNKTLTSPVISTISNTGTITLPTSTDTLVGRATTDTLTNKTLTSPVINTGVSGNAVLDDDTFATASSTTLATSESIKAYVDAQVDTVDTLTELTDTTISTPADNEVLAYDAPSSLWINQTPAEAGLAPSTINLDDVTTNGSTTSNSITVGDATVTGNLTVQGTTTTLDTTTLNVEDKNITINYSTGDSSGSANGAGITIQDAVNSTTDATILWDATGDKFKFSHAVDVTGNITLTGTVDGRNIADDGTKLDGIEASADVTDAANVEAAGAVMDGDFTANGFMKRTGAGTYTVDTNTYLTSLSVNGLSDVTITTPADNEILAYDSATSNWINQTAAEAGLLTGNQTITLSGDLSGSGTTSINAQIVANVVGANELNVSGNGTATQFLRSDGDGTFTWATPTDTNTTYTSTNGITLTGTEFSLDSDLRGHAWLIGRDSNDYIYVNTTAIDFRLDGNLDMRLENDGDLHVDGNVCAYSTTTSDERLKDNVTTIENALDKVCSMRGVEFDWNATSRKGQHDVGVIAQEVEQVVPHIVREMTLQTGEFAENNFVAKTVDYEKLTAVLIEAVKELKAEVEVLKNGAS